MKRKPDSMLPYLLVAALIAIPALTGFVHALRTGYGVTDTPIVAKKQAPESARFATNPAPVRQ